MSKLPYTIRQHTEADMGCIVQPWYRHSKKTYRWLSCATRDRVLAEAIRRAAADLPVFIACNREQPDQVFGWACAEVGKALHFVWVKETFRGLGLARELVEHVAPLSDITTPWTNWTQAGSALVAKLPSLGNFRPDLFGPFGKKEHDEH